MEGVTWASKQRHATEMLLAAPRALVAARAAASATIYLEEVWSRLRAHEWVVAGSSATDETASLTLRTLLPFAGDTSFERSLSILRRVLLGETQKSVAASFGIAPSTVALHCARALTRMGAATLTSRTPLVVVMAAHASAGFRFPLAQLEPAGEDSARVVVRLTDAYPAPPPLSSVEQTLLRGLMCGLHNAEIAADRGTSRRTVANQLGSVFRKFGVSGRGELLAKISRSVALRAPELGVVLRCSGAHVAHKPSG